MVCLHRWQSQLQHSHSACTQTGTLTHLEVSREKCALAAPTFRINTVLVDMYCKGEVPVTLSKARHFIVYTTQHTRCYHDNMSPWQSYHTQEGYDHLHGCCWEVDLVWKVHHSSPPNSPHRDDKLLPLGYTHQLVEVVLRATAQYSMCLLPPPHTCITLHSYSLWCHPV